MPDEIRIPIVADVGPIEGSLTALEAKAGEVGRQVAASVVGPVQQAAAPMAQALAPVTASLTALEATAGEVGREVARRVVEPMGDAAGPIRRRLAPIKQETLDIAAAWGLVTAKVYLAQAAYARLAAFARALYDLPRAGAQDRDISSAAARLGLDVGALAEAGGRQAEETQIARAGVRLRLAGLSQSTIETTMRAGRAFARDLGDELIPTVEALSRALITGNSRGLAPFGVTLDTTGSKAEQQAAILAKLAQVAETVTDESDSNVASYKRLEAAWEDVISAASVVVDGMTSVRGAVADTGSAFRGAADDIANNSMALSALGDTAVGVGVKFGQFMADAFYDLPTVRLFTTAIGDLREAIGGLAGEQTLRDMLGINEGSMTGLGHAGLMELEAQARAALAKQEAITTEARKRESEAAGRALEQRAREAERGELEMNRILRRFAEDREREREREREAEARAMVEQSEGVLRMLQDRQELVDRWIDENLLGRARGDPLAELQAEQTIALRDLQATAQAEGLESDAAYNERQLQMQAEFGDRRLAIMEDQRAAELAQWQQRYAQVFDLARTFQGITNAGWQEFWTALVAGNQAAKFAGVFIGMLADIAAASAAFFSAQAAAYFASQNYPLGAANAVASGIIGAFAGVLRGLAMRQGRSGNASASYGGGGYAGLSGGAQYGGGYTGGYGGRQGQGGGGSLTIIVNAGGSLDTADTIAERVSAAVNRGRDLGYLQ